MTTTHEIVIPYKESSFNNMDCAGIYFIYKNEELLYIGQTNNFEYRLTSYIRKQTHLSFEQATHVKIMKVSDDKERKSLEANLIKQYLPPMNYANTGGKSKRCLSITKKFKTAVTLDSDVYEQVKRIGEQEDRSFSQQVNKVLKDFLKSRE